MGPLKNQEVLLTVQEISLAPYPNFFIHLPVDGHLGLSHDSAMVDGAVVTIATQEVSPLRAVGASLGYVLRNGTAGGHVGSVLRDSPSVFHGGCSIYIPINSVEGSLPTHVLPGVCCLRSPWQTFR